jgi:glycogen(starch) synthase
VNVIFWAERFWPQIGGVEILGRQLILALRRRGHEFIVLTSPAGSETEGEAVVAGIPVLRLPFQRALARRSLKEIRKLTDRVAEALNTFQPDLIHLNSSQPSIFFLRLALARSSVPLLLTVHEPPDPEADPNSLLGRVIRSADWVAAVSRAMLLRARRLAPEITPRSSVVYNSLEPPLREPSDLPFNPPRLLGIGRMIPEKGFDLAIEALARVRTVFPEARLVLAGDGPARPLLEQWAAKLELGAAVEFAGWCRPEKITELINASTVVVVPSRWPEPFGLAALEAALNARPVVASRVGGLPEVVIHNETGLLFEKGDSAALAQQVIFLFQSHALAVRMGRVARQRALTRFSPERMAEEYDALYLRVGQWPPHRGGGRRT